MKVLVKFFSKFSEGLSLQDAIKKILTQVTQIGSQQILDLMTRLLADLKCAWVVLPTTFVGGKLGLYSKFAYYSDPEKRGKHDTRTLKDVRIPYCTEQNEITQKQFEERQAANISGRNEGRIHKKRKILPDMDDYLCTPTKNSFYSCRDSFGILGRYLNTVCGSDDLKLKRSENRFVNIIYRKDTEDKEGDEEQIVKLCNKFRINKFGTLAPKNNVTKIIVGEELFCSYEKTFANLLKFDLEKNSGVKKKI
jgi:hypothetical protein